MGGIGKALVCAMFLFLAASLVTAQTDKEPIINKVVLDNNDVFIYNEVTINNVSKLYDVELAAELSNANVEYDMDDLVDYRGTSNIPLIIRHDGNNRAVRNIKSLTEKNNGKLRIAYDRVPFLAVDMPRKDLKRFSNELRAINKDNKIYVDSKVRAFLDVSVPLVNAPLVWDMVDDNGNFINGTGIKIAIIDTGIDDSHLDFENKIIAQNDFVPSSYVIGGIDYGDGDDDNIADDKNGHGSHVASIAAGNGKASNGLYKGVALGAGLVIAKALNNNGDGLTSWIISGIEYAINNDADVISMSLGANNPEPALESVINQALANNVSVIAAAGNSGPGYYTIAFPGSMEDVITVGATDNSNNIAAFSSRGPVKQGYLIKPEIVAPGVDICAANSSEGSLGVSGGVGACSNANYMEIDGTSMATPHVAGAATLLKQAHPDWTPDMIKAALIGGSKEVSSFYNAYVLGSGRLDVNNALNVPVIVEQGVLNLGIISTSPQVDYNFTLRNLENINYGIIIEEENAKDLSLNQFDALDQITPNNFCLNANSKQNVSFNLLAADLPTGIYSVILKIKAYPNCDFTAIPKDVRFPVGFSKLKKVNINFIVPNIDANLYPYPFLSNDIILRSAQAIETPLQYYDLVNNHTVYTTFEEFDIFGMVSIANNPPGIETQDQIYTTYFVKGANMTLIDSISVTFNFNDAKILKNNVREIMEANEMAMYHQSYTFFTTQIPGFSTGAGLINFIDPQNFIDLNLTAAINISSPLFSTYEILYVNVGRQENISLFNATRLMSLPVNYSYPFTDLDEIVLDNEIKNGKIGYFGDNINGVDAAIEALTPYSLKQFGIFLHLRPVKMNKEINFTFRESEKCSVCRYVMELDVYNSSFTDIFSSDPYVFAQYFNGWKYPGFTNLPNVSFFEKPFKFKVQPITQFIFGAPYNATLFGSIRDKYSDLVSRNLGIFKFSRGSVGIISPNGTIKNGTGFWYIACGIPVSDPPGLVTCVSGNHSIHWDTKGMINGQEPVIDAVANWNNTPLFKWIVLEENLNIETPPVAVKKAYLTNPVAGLVNVLDLDTNTVIKKINVSKSLSPFEFVFPNDADEYNGKIYVTIPQNGSTGFINLISDKVAVINATTDEVIKYLNVGICPLRLDVNNGKGYVTTCNNTVAVIDANSDEIITIINDASFDQPYDVVIFNNKVYVANQNGASISTVSVIDVDTNNVVDVIDNIVYPLGIGAANGKIYVAGNDGYDGFLAVINPATNTVVKNISIDVIGQEEDFHGMSMINVGNKMYVADDTSVVSVVDVVNDNFITNIDVGKHNGASHVADIEAIGDSIYVTDTTDLDKINTSTDSLVETIPDMGAFGIAVIDIIGMPVDGEIFQVDSCDDDPNQPGIWKLTQDLVTTTSCFDILSDDIVLDCQGYRIIGPKPNGNELPIFQGITAVEKDNIEIRNCNVQNFTWGLYFSNVNSSKIVESTFSDNWGGYGIFLRGFGNLLENITIKKTKSENPNAILYGLYMQGGQNMLKNVNSTDNFQAYGIFIDSSDGNNLQNIFVSENWYGILISGYNNTINNARSIKNNYTGITIDHGKIALTNSVVDKHDLNGVTLLFTNNSMVDNLTIKNSDVGMSLGNAGGSIIKNSKIINNFLGIQIDSSNGNKIFNNLFNNTNNAYVETAFGESNNFWNTTLQDGVNIIGGNKIGGNFWSDYNGQDINGDGIGDTNLPYNVGIFIGGDYLPLTFGFVTTTAQIALKPGYNLISIPVKPVNGSLPGLLNSVNGQYSILWHYNSSAIPYWKSFNPSQPVFLSQLKKIDESQGFWIKALTNTTLQLDGTVSVGKKFTLKQGWNMMGYPSLEQKQIDNVFSNVIDNANSVYAYNKTLEQYQVFIPGIGGSLHTMDAGRGYWVNVNQNMTWMFDGEKYVTV